MPDSSSSLSCGATIKIVLTLSLQTDYEIGEHVGFRLRIVASEACGLDDEIFRYWKKPLNAQGVSESVLSGVCSWPDMLELPINEPEDDTSPAGFRLAYIDIVVDSESIATEVWELIQEQVQELLNTIKAGEELQAQPPVTITAT